ncbi:hypothetical protein ZEAMMB73_Zm00001d004595 [Zea mays]|uniref:Myb/SANT-like domain-containing protein n=2 Tax=Zea mays TaxID=4577 RepID=A0A1D6EGG9_MAIZE|nr:hypothetical protein ZEAMMB73_Zm00001d004595 [Zea mays]
MFYYVVVKSYIYYVLLGNIAMAKNVSRAAWNTVYEKGLVDVLLEHKDNPKFKSQNGWTAEGWNSITNKFNERYPLAHYSKQQMQDKDKELKSHYKAVRDSRKESGVGWNDSLCMIVAEPELWEKLILAHPKVAKYQKKPFPLYYSLEALHEGSVATGDLNFTSTQQMPPPSFIHVRPLNAPPGGPLAAPPSGPLDIAFASATAHSNRSTSEQSHSPLHPNTNPFSMDFQEISNEAQSRHVEGGNGRKRKQSQIGAAIESFVDFKRSATSKTLEGIEAVSMEKCLDKLDRIDGFTDEDRSYAMEVFESAINREVFMKSKNHNARLLWLKRKISMLSGSNT